MRDKPESCYASGCPLANTCRHCKKQLAEHPNDKCENGAEFESLSKGFVLGTGNPRTARYAFILEAPGKDEVSFRLAPVKGRAFFEDERSVNEEINIRQRDYPNISQEFLKKGAPVVGQSGAQLQYQGWPKSGIERTQVFLDNTLRCLPPKGKQGAYPTGAVKSQAEFCCRQYDRLDQYKPDTLVVSFHPSGILREITPLPLQVKDMEKVRDFTAAGRKVIGLLGGRAAQVFLGFAKNITRWRGHYTLLRTSWYNDTLERLRAALSKKTKKKRSEEDDEETFFPSSAHIKRKKALQAKLLSGTSPEDNAASTAVEKESSTNKKPATKRQRTCKKVSSTTSSESAIASKESSQNESAEKCELSQASQASRV